MTPQLFLHVGPPKTATSSLQDWCWKNREQLARDGVVYPDVDPRADTPRHQFLVSDLMSGDLTATMRSRQQWLGPRVLLSTEGLANHLYDFRPSALAAFRRILSDFEVTVILMARNSQDWIRSFHFQCVVNPSNPQFGNGTALTCEDFSQLLKIRRLSWIDGLREDLKAAYGPSRIETLDFAQGWEAQFLSILGLSPSAYPAFSRANPTPPDWVIEALRRLNALNLAEDDRRAWQAAMQDCFATGSVMLRDAWGNTTETVWQRLDLALIDRLASVGGPPIEDGIWRRLAQHIAQRRTTS